MYSRTILAVLLLFTVINYNTAENVRYDNIREAVAAKHIGINFHGWKISRISRIFAKLKHIL